MATEHHHPKPYSAENPPPPPPRPPYASGTIETGSSTTGFTNGQQKTHFPNPPEGYKIHYPNPPDATNPDPITLREQWKYATKQYSRWYAHSWGTAILGGCSLFAVDWIIKGSNPLPSKTQKDREQPHHHPPS